MEAPKENTEPWRNFDGSAVSYTSDHQVIISAVKKFLKGVDTVFCMPEIEDNVQGVFDCIPDLVSQG